MKVVVVGSGLAGVTTAEALAKDAAHEVSLVTAERQGYYARPRLSHGFSIPDAEAARIVLKSFDALSPGVRVVTDATVQSIDRQQQRIGLADGGTIGYDVLVLATGSAARIPPALVQCRDTFTTLNSFDDLLALRARRREIASNRRVPRWAIVGGGLIGCEAASDLSKAGDDVTVFHAGPRLLDLQLQPAQSEALHEHFAERNVAVRLGEDVRAIERGDAGARVVTGRGDAGPFDVVMVATGFAPRVALARDAGLDVDRGIVVNRYLRTSDPSIYAVGDVAQVDGHVYAFVSPIRSQALWLAQHLQQRTASAWTAPPFKPVIKIHDFKAPVPAPLGQP